MSLGRTAKLNTGATIPLVGLGTWQSKPNEVRDAVETALKTGYRHIDCAYAYKNEAEVGEALRNSGIPREQLFITSKLWCTFHRPHFVERAVDESLKALGIEYLDLYLVHWPVPLNPRNDPSENLFPTREDGTREVDSGNVTIQDTWKAMERLVDIGKVKAIGISNWNVRRIAELLPQCRIKPSVNQVELHPYLPQWDLLEYCNKNDILLTAYSPLGSTNSKLHSDDTLKTIAEKNKKSVAQVLISWAAQRGTVVIPKSVNKERILDNYNDFILSSEDMNKINELSKGKHERILNPKWGIDVFEDAK